MSIFSALNSAYSLEEAFHAKDVTSKPMRTAIGDWFGLYYYREPTQDSDPCQRIAYTIVNKLTRTTFGEYQASSRDKFAACVLAGLDRCRQSALQMTLVGGEAWLKPCPTAAGFDFAVISRDNVMIFGRDQNGVPIDIGTLERTVEGSRYYTLLERRTVDADGRLTIRNMLFVSAFDRDLGTRTGLQSLGRYAGLPDEYTYPALLPGTGLVRLKTPVENCVDGSADGVSVYAAAVGLIHNIDRNEAQINGEFERGESRIIASEDLLRKDKDGRGRLADHLFVGVDEDSDNIGVTIFSPALREQSFLARKQEYLRNAENMIGLKRGLLSEVEAVERTATEITSSAGDYNLTIIDFQRMWEAAVKEAVVLCGVLGELYRVPGAHRVEADAVAIDWGNGILYDEDKTWADYMGMVSAGLLKPEIALGWRFGMPVETEADLAAIREKYMPEVEPGSLDRDDT